MLITKIIDYVPLITIVFGINYTVSSINHACNILCV